MSAMECMKNCVGYCAVYLVDEQDSVKFPMRIFYPTGTQEKLTKLGPFEMSISQDGGLREGEYPLIIISHGNGGTPLAYRTLAHYLAAHGYIVDLRLVKNAGHFSFMSPWPKSLQKPQFPPFQDPPGFDRESFQDKLNSEVLSFLSRVV